MPPDQKRDYKVGYRKPPRQTRFTKGQSGNPRGRSPGAKNLKTLLSDALNEFVIVSENGVRRKITKREAIVTQLVNRSASADFRAIKILLDMVRDIEGQGRRWASSKRWYAGIQSLPPSPPASFCRRAEAGVNDRGYWNGRLHKIVYADRISLLEERQWLNL